MTGDLARVVQLAELMVQRRAAAEALKEQLTEAQAALRRIEQEDLPELMREIGLIAITLDDGSTVDVVEDVQCGISEERRGPAHRWLVDNGFGGLVKTEVVTLFDRGEAEAAREFAAEIAESTGHIPQVVETVHASTLKAFVKEQLAAGRAVPFDLFAIHPFNRARLKPPKR